ARSHDARASRVLLPVPHRRAVTPRRAPDSHRYLALDSSLGAFLSHLRLWVPQRRMMWSVFVAVVAAIDVVARYRPQVALGSVGIGDHRISYFAQQVDKRSIVMGARCSGVIL